MTDESQVRRPGRPARRRKKHFPWLFTLILATALFLIFAIIQYRQDLQEQQPPETQKPAGSAQIGDTLTLAAAGDISISPELLTYALQPDGSYDFSSMFLDVSPVLSNADLTVANLETNILPHELTGDNCRAPEALLTALRGAGVDLLQTANTASIFNGISGLTATHQAVVDAGLIPIGTFPTEENYRDTEGFTLLDVQGFRVAFVAFTKGLDNLRLPEGSENAVNLLYTDYHTTYQTVNTAKIQGIMKEIRKENPDIIIALVHWGSEYESGISKTQKTIEKLLLDGGATAILGSHSRILGEVDTITTPGTATAYCLGTLLATEQSRESRESMVLTLEFTKGAQGTTVTDWSYTPIYVATAQEAGSPRILHAENAITRYETDFIDKIPEDLYNTLVQSLDRIRQRVAPEEE